jgi:hypothetical protein
MSENEIGPDQIIEWLDSQSDFTLEMQVFSHTQSLGFHAEHGGTYEDPVTKRPRQFDVRAIARNGTQNKCSIKLAVECKALSSEFPLVIQRSQRSPNESFHEIFHAHKRGHFDHKGEPIPSTTIIPGLLPDARILRTKSESSLYRNFTNSLINSPWNWENIFPFHSLIPAH